MITTYLAYCLGGILLGLAWIYPSTEIACLLSFGSLILLIYPSLKQGKGLYLGSFLYGLISHSIAFYWIFNTIKDFGGYNSLLSTVFYLLFIISHALPFPLFIYIFKRLDLSLINNLSLRTFFAWTTSIHILPRIFPWHFGHGFSALPVLTQIADLAGVLLVSCLMFVIAETFVKLLIKQNKAINYIFSGSFLFISLIYGFFRINQYSSKTEDQELKVSLIQAAISIEEKGNAQYIATNLRKYLELSLKTIASYQPDLIIWPESVITNPIPAESIYSVLPHLNGNNLIIGSLTSDSEGLHNSALALDKKMQNHTPYHKRILMPFGEYMPFARYYPELKQLNPLIPDFVAGKSAVVFNISEQIKAAPLICYEDLIPALSAEAVKKGATILVNLTNDAWFGKTVAPKQHHLIASFRAIEQRRFLLRSTNSGLTAIVNPIGKTTAEIPIFSENVINAKIYSNQSRTLYSIIGNIIWWLITGYVILLVVYRYIKPKGMIK